MRNIKKLLIVISIFILIFCIIAICIRVDEDNKNSGWRIIGGSINHNSDIMDIEISDSNLSRKTISVINKRMEDLNEIYFRPSKLKALNNVFMDLNNFNETFQSGSVPPALLDDPENAVLNYFSVLQQASNLTEAKTGGCGTIGYEKSPYPIAYDFFTENYKKLISYKEYITSFEGIGHINLIKLLPVISKESDKHKYFVELEILEGSNTGATAFNYYTGQLDLIKEKGMYHIDSFSLTPEDFFCAAYHGWAHDAELFVETVYGNWCGLIMKQYSPQTDELRKNIVIDGTDGNKYMFEFARLTNGTDLIINTFVKNNDNWLPVEINIDTYMEKAKNN